MKEFNKILLGRDKDNELMYLTKHEWSCNWYWSLGYLGNRNCHYHLESFLDGKHYDINDVFSDTKLNQSQWYIILDLFKQAYDLKKCAEVYQHGGYIYSKKGLTDMLKSEEKAQQLNSDLESLLYATWTFICGAINNV